MPLQKAQFAVKGMSRDLADSKFNPEFAFENQNIRITPTDNSTLLVLSNEKGNTDINTHPQNKVLGTYTDCTITNRNVLGYAVLYKTIVLFFKANINGGSDTLDCISKIYWDTEPNTPIWREKILYSGNLNFSIKNLIETLPLYEAEDIQKVYWVDGLNQPRVINIVEDEDHIIQDSNDNQFDFVTTLGLNDSITIKRWRSVAGRFPAGALQYAFTYSKKNGQETRIAWISNVHYTTFEDRGGAPDELTPASYKITIDYTTVDTTFDNINIYSILRTSEDGGLQVKLVTQLDIDSNRDTDYEFIDTNNTGETIAPTDLLYKGGEILVADTLATKDNTLFLGNIEYKGNTVDDEIKEEAQNCTPISGFNIVEDWLAADGFYPYKNPLLQDVVTYLRKGNTYRLGLQLQDERGGWSEPIFVDDYAPTNRPYIDRNTGDLYLPKVSINLTPTFVSLCSDYKKIRPVVVFPEAQERGVIAQGIVSPTVFRKESRLGNLPYAQSSWFFRPYNGNGYDGDATSKYSVEARHCHSLGAADKYNAEVQNATLGDGSGWATTTTPSNNYYVDGSILTFHSPDIDDTLMEGDLINSNLKIVGAFSIDSLAGRAQVVGSAPIDPNGHGEVPRSQTNVDKGIGETTWDRNIFTTQTLWLDRGGLSLLFNYYYATYPWHSTTLWEDFTTVEPALTEYSKLLNKVLSNTRISQNFEFYSTSDEYPIPNGLRDRRLFRKENGDSALILTAPSNLSQSIPSRSLYYRGTISEHIVSTTAYDIYYASSINGNLVTDISGDNLPQDTSLLDINIQYRSTDHVVLSLNNSADGETQELPVPVFNTLDPNGTKTRRQFMGNPFWLNGSGDIYQSQLWSSQVLVYDVEMSNPDFLASLSDNQTVISVHLDGQNFGIPCTLTVYIYDANAGTFNWNNIYNTGIELSPDYQGLASLLLHEVTMFGSIAQSGLNQLRTTALYCNVTDRGHVWEIPIQDAHTAATKALPSAIEAAANLGSEVMWITELTRDLTDVTLFGGQSNYAIKNNRWLPCGEAVAIDTSVDVQEGDTIFNRWDCLKTLPYTPEDPNQVVEIMSFMCESYVNTAGRYDKNKGETDYTYLNSSIPFNVINPAYNNKDNFFTYRITDLEKRKDTAYPTLVTWSMTKTLGEEIDSWTHIVLASSMSMDGDRGKVRALRRYKNSIFCFQDKGIAEIIYNPTTAIATTAGVPIEIANSGKVEGKRYVSEDIGCTNKWSICITPSGIYFIDSINKKVYHWSDSGMNCLSEQFGFTSFFNANMGKVVDRWYPTNWQDHNDFITQYDRTVGDVYFISNNKCLAFNESLGQFTSFYDYKAVSFFINLDTHCFSIKSGKLWEQHQGPYNTFFGGSPSPYYTEVVVNPNPTVDKIFDNIEFRADSWNADGTLRTDTFDTLTAYNEYQEGTHSLVLVKDKAGIPYSPLKKKFRVWYANIPRNTQNKYGDSTHNYTRDRMRNTWIHLKLEKHNPGTERTVLHDLQVKYFI